jgi:hypothetical protein
MPKVTFKNKGITAIPFGPDWIGKYARYVFKDRDGTTRIDDSYPPRKITDVDTRRVCFSGTWSYPIKDIETGLVSRVDVGNYYLVLVEGP